MIKDIGISVCSCGCCCSKDELCDKCKEATLKSNGLDLKYKSELDGLSHQGFYQSEVSIKLNEIIRNEIC